MNNTINLRGIFILFVCTAAILFSAFAVTFPPTEGRAQSDAVIEETDNSSLHNTRDYFYQHRPFR